MACEEKNYWFTATERPANRGFGVRKPRGFTGKRGDNHYYLGRLWLGPTNAVGQASPGGFSMTKTEGGRWGIR